jgi:hypothetical protein
MPRQSLRKIGSPALFVACTFAVALVVAPAHAQDGGTPAPPPDTLLTPVSPPAATTPPPEATPVPPPPAVIAAPVAADTAFDFPLLFDLRTREEIQRDVDLQSRVRTVAQGKAADARAVQTRRKYDADIKGTEIDAAKKRLDLAKKEKRTADVKSLDDARKRLEAQKDYLEKLRDKAGAEADYQQAIADYATARNGECGAEFAVLALGDLNDAGTRGSASARATQLKLNDAFKARATAGGTLADREKTLCDRRKAAYDAWVKLGR